MASQAPNLCPQPMGGIGPAGGCIITRTVFSPKSSLLLLCFLSLPLLPLTPHPSLTSWEKRAHQKEAQMHNPFLNTSLSFYFYLSLTTLHLQINLQDPYNRFVFFLPLFFLSFFYLFSCFFFGQNVDLSLSITVTRGKGWWCRKRDNGCFLELEERRIREQEKY